MLTIEQLDAQIETADGSASSSLPRKLLQNINLHINQSEIVALVGESGSGKSLTAHSILRLLEDVSPITLSGSIIFKESEILALPVNSLRKIRGNRISMIFQEPMSSLNPVYTIGNQIMESLTLHQNLSGTRGHEEAVNLLFKVGISEPELRMKVYPHQLSGGQRQRVMIAMALACKPDLLIADEPTTALDVTIQASILKLIKDLQTETGMSVLLISHDLNLVKHFADRIYILQNGRIVESGSCQTLFDNPTHPYTRKLLASLPPKINQIEIAKQPVLIHSDDLNCTFKLFKGWKHPFKRSYQLIKAVDHVKFSIHRGTTCGIIGESGSGKSTLAFALLKLVPSSGSIYYQKEDLNGMSRKAVRKLRKELQIVFQDPFSSLSPRMSIREIVSEGLTVHFPELSEAERVTRVNEVLADVGLDSQVGDRYPHEFSGGQRQRIAIARALILRPELLILDEPTSALDMTIQTQIIELLLGLQLKYQLTYIFISHDLKVIRAIADTVLVMRDGKIVESGSPEKIFHNPVEEYTRTLIRSSYLSN